MRCPECGEVLVGPHLLHATTLAPWCPSGAEGGDSPHYDGRAALRKADAREATRRHTRG